MRVAVDDYLDQKEKYAFIARVMTARGFKVSADIVSKHNGHRHEYAPPAPAPRTEKRDIAKLLQERMGAAIEAMDDEDLFAKDYQPAIANALKAQVAIDKREATRKQTTADVLVGLLAALRGEGRPAPLQLDDGKTIEGEFSEAD